MPDWKKAALEDLLQDKWDDFYADAYRHMHEDSGFNHEDSDKAAREFADYMTR